MLGLGLHDYTRCPHLSALSHFQWKAFFERQHHNMEPGNCGNYLLLNNIFKAEFYYTLQPCSLEMML